MKAVVIGASSESVYAINKAKEMGLYVQVFDGDPSAPGLAIADESCVVDIKDPSAVFDILDKNPPNVVLPVPIGRVLTTAGAVNDRYGLKGVSYSSALLCTDKYEFHQCLDSSGLRDAGIILVPSGESGSIDCKLHYPVVVKPRFGSGSRGVEIFEDSSALGKGFLDFLPFDEDYIIESCIPGKEYGVDGVFEGGFFTRILMREKRITPAPYRQCTGYYSVKDNDENLVFLHNADKLVSQAGRALGFKDNLIHADIIRLKDDTAFLIEMSARPSGHNLYNLFTPLASGIDEEEEFIKYTLGMHHSFIPSDIKRMMIGYFDMEDVRIDAVPDEDYIKNKYPVTAYDCRLEKGMELGVISDGRSLMNRGYFCIEALDRDELDSYRQDIINEFQMVRIC